jgi:hypothetical protein
VGGRSARLEIVAHCAQSLTREIRRRIARDQAENQAAETQSTGQEFALADI